MSSKEISIIRRRNLGNKKRQKEEEAGEGCWENKKKKAVFVISTNTSHTNFLGDKLSADYLIPK